MGGNKSGSDYPRSGFPDWQMAFICQAGTLSKRRTMMEMQGYGLQFRFPYPGVLQGG